MQLHNIIRNINKIAEIKAEIYIIKVEQCPEVRSALEMLLAFF